jgi:hypothetical protein
LLYFQGPSNSRILLPTKIVSNIPIVNVSNIPFVGWGITKILGFFRQTKATAPFCCLNPHLRISWTLLECRVAHKTYSQGRQESAEFPFQTQHKLSPYHSNQPHLCGLPKIHISLIPLRPIVSSVSSPFYVLDDLLCKIVSPLAGKSE